MTLMKICGIKTPELAARTVQLGAGFIGLVFDPTSPRFIDDITRAKEISFATHEAGGQVVAVFLNQSEEEVHHTQKAINADYIQAHFTKSRSKTNIVNTKKEKQHTQLAESYQLLDNPTPGSGSLIHLKDFQRPSEKFFIAGGLNPDNVQTIIQTYQPDGVDVSSGVEACRGQKDFQLIQQFIERVRTC